MMHPARRPQRVGERMDHAEPLVKTDPPEQRSHHQPSASLEVSTVADCGLEPTRHVLQTLERDPVADRVYGDRKVTFDAMRERIHPGRGGQCRWQPDGERG